VSISLWGPVLLAFMTALVVLRALLRGKLFGRVVDRPNERSLHEIPTPRTGGLGLMAGILVGWGLLWQPWLLPIGGGVLFLMLVSFLDDLRGLSAGVRILAHFLVAGVIVGNSGITPLWMFPTVLAIVWMTNLYNFMDGSDGLAGGMALLGFASYAAAAWSAGDSQMAQACAVIAASASAFLLYNFHPARIFMGDTGSIALGFMAGVFGFYGWQHHLWPLWFPMLVFSPFIVDATVTLFRRLLRREKVWQAHRSHYYQRLVRMGVGHRKTAIFEYSLMAVVGGCAIWMIGQPLAWQLSGLIAWSIAYIVLALWVDRLWRDNSGSSLL